MSFWKTLFGSKAAGADAPARIIREVEHKGFRIAAMPYADDGQFQVAGLITKEIQGTTMRHRFVRADRFGTIDEAAEFAIMKGCQIVDLQGERIFEPRTP